ncbi:BESS motif [Popillia japonica]|uniref:BESS motif n=1 Tax=Popillia japonica TaxID=7064 RepID=A0AAW1IA20_POPJA
MYCEESEQNVREDMLEIERKKLRLMEKRLTQTDNADNLNKDEDYMFFKSVLPAMKKLSDLQRFQLPGKINDRSYGAQ